jgi:endoglucanase
MKKFTLFISFFSFLLGISQNLITNGDFESGPTGWSGNALNVVTEGGNKYNAANVLVAGQPFAVNLSHVLSIPTSGVSYKLKFTAFSDTTRPLIAGIGLAQDPWTAATQSVTLTTTSQVFEVILTSNFSSPTSRIIFDMGHATGFVGIDNVSLEITTAPPPPAGPATAASTPPARPVADVISAFSDAYANIAVPTWGADWGPSAATISDVSIVGNATKRINFTAGKVFAGIVLGSYNDLSTFTHFHMDYWIANPILTGQALSIKLSNHATQNGETSAIQTVPTPQGGAWVSLDVPLADFIAASNPPNLARSSIKEIVITAARANDGQALELYFDNLYFHKNTLSSATNELSQFSMYPNPANDVLNINAKGVIENISIVNMVGQNVLTVSPNETFSRLNINQLPAGIYVVTSVIEGVTASAKFIKK